MPSDIVPYVTDAPLDSAMFDEYSGAGLEEVRSSDLVMPRLVILQSTSPAIQEEDSPHRIGELYNITISENYGRKIQFIALSYWKSRTLWATDDIGSDIECSSVDANVGTKYGACDKCEHADWTGEGDNRKPPRCTDFQNFLILPQLPDQHIQDAPFMIYAAKRSALRAANRFITSLRTLMVKGKNPPIFATVWELSTVQQTNAEKGAKFYTPEFKRLGFVTRDVAPFLIQRYEEFKQMRQEIMKTVVEDSAKEKIYEGTTIDNGGVSDADATDLNKDLDDDKPY